MDRSEIRNVVFDIGNVIVRWDPDLILARAFQAPRASHDLAQTIFSHDIWHRLNTGAVSEEAAKREYREVLNLARKEVDALFFHVKDTQDLNLETVELVRRLAAAKYRVFALSDNVREIVAYLRQKYDFWELFEGSVISAEVGFTKPSRQIFDRLLDGFDLIPQETVFLDDVQRNVEGARAVGIHALRFSGARAAEAELADMGLRF